MNPSPTLIFDRTPVARVISCAACFASAALVFHYIAGAQGDIDVSSLVGLILLFLGTLAAAAIQYGDHIYFSEIGVMYENTLLRLLGKPGRWMKWEDIVEIREMKRKVLVLLSRDGERMLVDAVAPRRTRELWRAAMTLTREDVIAGAHLGYAIARAEILRRAPHAIVSGTLARDDS
ncbi:MAG: hypothetical protein JWO56_450 [Acidobacteria bacterium]|nr:hypothetical protein [Acidobacteriota bacterium]